MPLLAASAISTSSITSAMPIAPISRRSTNLNSKNMNQKIAVPRTTISSGFTEKPKSWDQLIMPIACKGDSGDAVCGQRPESGVDENNSDPIKSVQCDNVRFCPHIMRSIKTSGLRALRDFFWFWRSGGLSRVACNTDRLRLSRPGQVRNFRTPSAGRVVTACSQTLVSVVEA